MMLAGRVIVFDVGKTLAKLSLWDADGRLLEQQLRYNHRPHCNERPCLDTQGIEEWALGTMTRFAQRGRISAIVPVAHGAAAAVIRNGALACPVLDYEDSYPAELRLAYNGLRDAFEVTGSPALPLGLNLGAQLYRIEREYPDALGEGATILPWPQYWAWKMSGVAASEVSSLGCHSDLWRPGAATHSALALGRGWAQQLAPLRFAGDVLGPISVEWASRTGLSPTVSVYCGLHDSNAALLAARALPEVAGRDATVVSTGTWFVAMRLPAGRSPPELTVVPESRDCLINVDVHGSAVPSARFMGGRELETLGVIDTCSGQDETLQAVPKVVTGERMVLPTWASGVGPFPNASGTWIDKPHDPPAVRAAVLLYAALMVDASLDLIGTRDRIVIEGRFAQAEVFVRALAKLRPSCTVYANENDHGVPYGALRLVSSGLSAIAGLRRITPLEIELSAYKKRWLDAVKEREKKHEGGCCN